MCLLAIAWKTHPRWRLVLAGNRDEAHERPTASLARWADFPSVLAGRDLRSGGTWAAASDDGRMAVVTNVRDPRIAIPQAPSRGVLPVEFLRSDTSVMDNAERLLPRAADFAPFNLLLADASEAVHLSNHPRPRQQRIEPGVHGLSNGDLDEPWPKTRRLMQAMTDWVSARDDSPDRLWLALADERQAGDPDLPDTGVGPDLERMLSAAFIRNPVYGTRASTLIAIDHDGHGWISERRFGPDGGLQGETTLAISP